MELLKEQNKMSAVILAGGANTRFKGKTKANIQISGVRIIARTVKILHDIFEEIIIVTNTPDDFNGYKHFTIVPDEIKNVGPLGGIHAAMRVANNDAVFVFASDMPCLSSALIKKHIDFYNKRECDAAIPRIREGKEPLHSIYHTKIFDRLDKFLTVPNKYSFDNFIKDLDIRYNNLDDIVEHRRAFININSPQDLSCMSLYDEVHHF